VRYPGLTFKAEVKVVKTPVDQQYPHLRAYPRLPLATPVEIHYADRKILCRTENISIGGFLAHCRNAPPTSAELNVLFNLPNGITINTKGVVKHRHRGRFGVQFSSLPPTERVALEGFTARMENFTRRGERIARRLHVTIRSMHPDKEQSEQMAETVLLSQNGGLMVCRAKFDVGERLRLYWPEKKRSTEIVIVFRRPCGTADLVELGFEFLEDDNFWGMGFSAH
jgi:hypothetical protein